jgi:hypothetical protein
VLFELFHALQADSGKPVDYAHFEDTLSSYIYAYLPDYEKPGFEPPLDVHA